MKVLGIESSCDDCSIAVVEDGRKILSSVVATQIEIHRPFMGVVPEIASRTHTEWIEDTYFEALRQAGLKGSDLDGIAVTSRPGLVGSLLVGLSFAKGLVLSLGVPYTTVNHVMAHLYAPQLEREVEYPFLGLLVSGGHTMICVVDGPEEIRVMGTTIDDACGEAFDKVAKFYNFGFPGGVVIDQLAQKGNPLAFKFPGPNLHKGDHRYDVSYSGLKNAVINQSDQFWDGISEKSPENIAASFQRRAIDILVKRVLRAVEDTGLKTVVAGGGVAANSYLRSRFAAEKDLEVIFPPLALCTDNGAMIAGLGYHRLKAGETSGLYEGASARVEGFRVTYP